MDERIRDLRSTTPAPGYERVMVAGQPEWENMQDRKVNGIPLHPTVIEMLKGYAAEVRRRVRPDRLTTDGRQSRRSDSTPGRPDPRCRHRQLVAA